MIQEDNVNHPLYYANQCSLECIEAMRVCFGDDVIISWCKATAFKYLWRYKNKHQDTNEDLHKAEWYVQYARKLLNTTHALLRTHCVDIQLCTLEDIIEEKINLTN